MGSVKEAFVRTSLRFVGLDMAMVTTEYIKQALQEHLLTNTYKQLSEMEAKNRMIHLKEILKNLVATHSKSLSKPELTYFQRSLSLY